METGSYVRIPLVVFALVSFAHALCAISQTYKLTSIAIPLSSSSISQNANLRTLVPLTGGILFPRPLASGVYVDAKADGRVSYTIEDSDTPPLQLKDIGFQMLLSILALVMGCISFVCTFHMSNKFLMLVFYSTFIPLFFINVSLFFYYTAIIIW